MLIPPRSVASALLSCCALGNLCAAQAPPPVPGPLNGAAPGDRFGFSVAVVDDFNGDGFPDIATGAPFADFAGTDSGRVYVHSGADGTLIRTHDGAAAGDQFGWDVSAIGDLNNDGIGELIVGAPYRAVAVGAAYVYSGVDGALIYFLPAGTTAFANFGYAVADAGDATGDGVTDILVTSPLLNNHRGQAQIFSGSTGALTLTVTNASPQVGDDFGISAAGLGDLDGDLRADFVVGSFSDELDVNPNSWIDTGTASVFSGATGALLAKLEGDGPGQLFGRSVASLGDLTGDGLAEFAVGASGYGILDGTYPGRVWVFSGAPGMPLLYQVAGIAYSEFGHEITALGDWNYDGTNDFAIGAYQDDPTGALRGFVRVHSGSNGTTLLDIIGDSPDDDFGFGLSSGDVNSDGKSDLLVGAPLDDDGGLDAGRVQVFPSPLAPPPVGSGTLSLVIDDCQDDVSTDTEYQIEVELHASDLVAPGITAFYAALSYDMGVLAYRGDLSSYNASAPFPLHITPLLQGDDGTLGVDGSVTFGGSPITIDSLLATLVFDVLAACDPLAPPIQFDAGSPFLSELSLSGNLVATTLVDPQPVVFDDTAPVLANIPAAIVQPADGSLVDSGAGAIVHYTAPTASDDCNFVPLVVCTPPSGSFFPVGTQSVTCTATDACGNTSTTQFDVTITATNRIDVELVLDGCFTPVIRCIHFLADGCAGIDLPVDFVDHDMDPLTFVRGFASFELPSWLYDSTSICAKDQQHTQWAGEMLVLEQTFYTTVAPIVLHGGDTDDDGDIDIHDVTLFLVQFGAAADGGSCGWNGVRDADFNNDGTIGTEDYVFLGAGWLTSSSCACALTSGRDPLTPLPADARVKVLTPLHDRADLNRDGWVDVLDVELLEVVHGWSGELSKRMRGR